MRIGLAFDLRKAYLAMGFSEEETAEFDSEETINHLDAAIRGLGHEIERIGHIFDLTKLLAAGKKWDLVFNVTEGLRGRNRESQVPALLEAYDIPYTFADPLTLGLSLDKALAKRIVKDAGVPTPEFFVIESGLKGIPDIKSWPLFAKPVAEGTGKGVTPNSIIRNRAELESVCSGLIKKYNQAVIVETYLPGREVTVGILGTGDKARAVGALDVKLLQGAEEGVYSYINKEKCETLVEYALVRGEPDVIAEASDIALKAYRALECRDAGRVDLRADGDGRFQFLEVNPLAGLHPTHSDLPILCAQAGISYPELISCIISSASERIKKQQISKPE